ncbi:MAG: DNA repair and recombination protein RadA [Nitrososphaeraceae archaeon]|nr:DNA repair and recombination protein RadA [Nitrososphaeraceae archaeon]
MSGVSDLQLEDLPGVEPHLISKLKRAGIQSVLDLAVSVPHELAIGDYEGNGIAADVETISELVMRAQKALTDSGILTKEFCTADEVLERRKSLVRFTTGSANLDAFLKGGVETQAITEIAGEFGSGKSQICHTLCVTANLSKGKGKGRGKGLDSIIFIDTENTFRPERIHQIAEARGLDSEEIMKRVFVCKINNSAQLEAIIRNLSKSIEQYRAKLVIVDSIISLHRAEYPGRESLAERQQRLNVMLHKLVRLAEIYNIAIIVTNQVQSQPDNFFGNSNSGADSTRASGGNIMGHACTYRIFLRKAGHDSRIAIMVDSPYHHAYDQVRFTISEKGVENAAAADEGNKKTLESSESGW